MRSGTPLGPALILIAIAALSLGCSEERPAAPPAEPTAATPQPRGARASAEAPGELDWAVIRAISAEWKKMKGASGRTGILAEKPRYSLFTEELVIRDFFQDREGGYFVDVGCAWPVHASNTYYLEKHLGWSGIGIDALADYAGAWGEERPRSKFFQFIVTDRVADSGRFFRSEGLGLSSVDSKMASGELFGVKRQTEEIEVPMTTLNHLLDQQGVRKIDLLALDIEGHEPEALRGFDVARFQPELIVVEGKDPRVVTLLGEHGYHLLERYREIDTVNRYFGRADASEKVGG